MQKAPYGTKAKAARKSGVTREYAHRVLAQYLAGTLIVRTPKQARIVRNYLATLKEFTPHE